MTKISLKLSLRLLDRVVLSRTAATAGGHETLDYIPGSALLGVAAGALYRKCRDSWLLFHSGKVRFSNAYPVTSDGSMGLPSPLSYFVEKASASRGSLGPGLGDFIDRSMRDSEEGAQLSQVRGLYLTGDGRRVGVDRSNTLRTAIDERRGTAKENALYDYQSISAGSRFVGFVDLDTEDECFADEIASAFNCGSIRLGRSRSAEYGRVAVAVERIDLSTDPRRTRSTPSDIDHRIYCVSDIALFDLYGSPKRDIAGEDFGLPGTVVDWGRSHLRHRRYSPFNAALRTYESERIVVEKGSVFVLVGNTPRREGMAVVGAHREGGLGQIWYDPPFLGRPANREWSGWTCGEPPLAADDAPEEPADLSALRGMLAWRVGEGADADLAWAQRLRPIVVRLYEDAALLAKGDRAAIVGPQASQWARIAEIAANARDTAALRTAVSEVLDRGHRNEGAEDFDWRLMTADKKGQFCSFGDWIRARISDSTATPNRILHLARLAGRIAKGRLPDGQK